MYSHSTEPREWSTNHWCGGSGGLRSRAPGYQRESWSWAPTLWSREKAVTCPNFSSSPAFPGLGTLKSSLQKLTCRNPAGAHCSQLEFGDCHFWHLKVSIYILSLMLLLSLINLINNAALIYSYAPRETFILVLECTVSGTAQYCSELVPATAVLPALISTQSVSVCHGFYFYLPFTWCFASFLLCPFHLCSLVVLEGRWAVSWPAAFPQSPLESSANLSDYFILQSCHRPLSESGVNPGSGEAWKGVGEKYQGSDFATHHQWQEHKTMAMACYEETSGCVIPMWVKGLRLGRTEPPDSNLKWEEALLSRQGMCVREIIQSQSGCGLEHEHVNRADERLQQMWTEQQHFISREKWGT